MKKIATIKLITILLSILSFSYTDAQIDSNRPTNIVKYQNIHFVIDQGAASVGIPVVEEKHNKSIMLFKTALLTDSRVKNLHIIPRADNEYVTNIGGVNGQSDLSNFNQWVLDPSNNCDVRDIQSFATSTSGGGILAGNANLGLIGAGFAVHCLYFSPRNDIVLGHEWAHSINALDSDHIQGISHFTATQIVDLLDPPIFTGAVTTSTGWGFANNAKAFFSTPISFNTSTLANGGSGYFTIDEFETNGNYAAHTDIPVFLMDNTNDPLNISDITSINRNSQSPKWCNVVHNSSFGFSSNTISSSINTTTGIYDHYLANTNYLREENVAALNTPQINVTNGKININNLTDFTIEFPNTTNTSYQSQYHTKGNYQVFVYNASNTNEGLQIAGPIRLGQIVVGLSSGDYAIRVYEEWSNNLSPASNVVTINIDTEAPNAVCQNTTIQLDATGNASIVGVDVDGGSTDNVGIVSYTVTPNSFDCSDTGSNTVVLTVTDAAGNTDTCTANVTVEDNIAPTVITQNATVQLDANGIVNIGTSIINNGSFDNCDITLSLDQITFTCDDLGNNTVTLTATDPSGNNSSESAILIVEDIINPTVIGQPATGNLNGTGTVTIPVASVDGGSFDNCDVSLTLTPNTYTAIGTYTAVLEGTDSSGNNNTVNVSITIIDTVDNTPPNAVCQNLTVSLDVNGNATIQGSDIDGGSTDNVAIATLIPTPNSFTCSDIGTNTVTLTVTDTSGNTDTCTATVTVVDDLAPINSTQTITLDLADGSPQTITWNDLDNGTTDNCTIASGTVNPDSFNAIGTYDVDFTTVDSEGNQTTTVQEITVENTLGVEDQEIAGLVMYPNPADNVLHIEAIETLTNIKLYNLLGQILINESINTTQIQLSLEKLSSGMYLIEISNKEGRKAVKRLIKK